MIDTVITEVVDEDTNEVIGYNVDEHLGDQVVKSLMFNNSFVPNIERVIFNTKTTEEVAKLDLSGAPLKDEKGRVLKETVKLENPVLATTVFFADGTKVTVKNSDKDEVTVVDKTVKLSDGSEISVKTASQESKEIGVVHAIVKRCVCQYDESGNVTNAGYAKFLHTTVEKAHVQEIERAKVSAERKLSKQKAKNTAKPKKDRSKGLRAVVQELAEVVAGLRGAMKDSNGCDCETCGEK